MRTLPSRAPALLAALPLLLLACSDQLTGPGEPPTQTQSGPRFTHSSLGGGAQALTTALGDGWESGLNGWTALTTSGVATWHVVTHPESLAISPALNPVAVTLADDGSHLPAAQGTNVVWFGNDDTGTYIGSDYPQPVSSKGGGSSNEAQSGTLTSPPISLAGFAKAQLEFDSWWEVEGVASTDYDLMKVEVSSDNGVTFTQVAQLNPTFATAEPDYAAYSSGGPSAAPVWRHYAFDLSSYAGSTIQVRFEFDSSDINYNAFRGWTIDNVDVGGGSALPAPTLTSVSPTIATTNDVVTINGTQFAQGATFQLGTTTIAASSIVQFGTDSLIFKVPSGLTAGSYDVTVTNPDGQTATLTGAFTYSATASPTVNAPTASPAGVSPASVGLLTAQDNVTINGTGFVAGATVLVGSTPATNVVVASATQITATFPALGAGTYNVTVTNPSGQSGTGYAEYTAADNSVITVTAPASGASWGAGTTQNITWTVTGTSVVSIDLYKGGTFVSTLAASIDATTGNYAWAIPGNLALGADYTIKIYNPNGTSGAFSAGTFSVTLISTTTTLTSSLNPALPTDSVSFTAQLSPAGATGSVQFADNGSALGAPVAVSGGVATSSAVQLAAGSHTITATFAGTGGYASSSNTLTELSNTPPSANAQSVTTAEDTAKAITLAGFDADGDGLTYSVVAQPGHGTLTGAAPDLTYTPGANYNGSDSFTFTVTDANAATSSLATVSLTVTSVNDAPVASGQAVSTAEDTSLPITLAATDVDGDTLSYSVVTPPAHGTLTGTAPNLTYVPSANYNGPDSFTFKANDGTVDSSPATISLTVTSVNDAPVATPQSITTAEDTSAPITLSATDADNDPLTYVLAIPPAHGSLSGTLPNLTYVPNANYNGPDSFTFEASDGTVYSTMATVSITVTAVNDAPVAAAQSVTTDEDTSLAITLAATDVDGDTLSYSLVTPPAHGTLTGTAPDLTYVPNANYNGPDSFTFKANDGTADSNVATVSLTVSSVNDAPVASGQSITTDEDTSAPINLGATDVDGDALSFSVVTPPTHGTLTGTGSSLTYVPDANFNGADSFTFQANDGVGSSNVATVSLTVAAVDDAPVATAQSVTTDEDTSLLVTLAATDVEGDALTFAVVTPPAHGTLTGTAPDLTYVPDANYNGPDSFTFKASDGSADSNVATVSVSLTAVDDAPVASAQSLITDEDTSLPVTLAATDVEGDSLSFAVVTPPAHGTLTGAAPNLTYVPDANYNGPDSFAFEANDGQLDSAPATVSLTVTAVNDAPVAQPQSVTTAEDTSHAITLAASDLDGDALNFIVVTPPAHGTLTGTAPDLTYVPNANYNGPDSFTFKASDGSADSNVATVDLTVTAVNDTPVAAAQSLSISEDTSVAISLAATDVDGDLLTYAVVTPPAHGTLTGSAPNLTYVPAANYDGPDSFTFVANDGSVDSAIATVSLSVTAVNDAPVATSGSVTTDEDTPAPVVLAASDLDADSLSYRIVTPPAHGTLSGTAPDLVYTPAANYHGPDGFSFSVNDGSADSNVATVSLTVTSVNDAPVAAAQSITASEDGSVEIVLTGSDVDGDSIGFTILAPPAHGTLSGTAPNLVYTPEANYHGADSFTFATTDGTLSSAAATVTLSVSSVNDAPVAQDQSLTSTEDTQLPITLVASDLDGDALEFTIVTPPAHGTLSGSGAQLVYTPAANYDGPDQFSFKANDGTADSNVSTVSLDVTAVDDVPLADGQSVTLKADIATPVTLTGSDVEAAALTYRVLTPPAHGTLSGTAPNLVYTPANDFHGLDHFTFSVSASGVESAPATVSIVVEATQDALSGGAVGCSASGGGDGAYLFLAIAALLFFRRRSERPVRRARLAGGTVAALGAAALVAVPAAARAQGRIPAFDAETFQPSPGAAGSLVTESGLLLAPGELRLSLTAGDEHDPLVFVRNGERLGSIVGSRLTSYLSAAWSPTAWLEIGAQLPLVLDQRGDDLSAYGLASPTSTTVGTSFLQAQIALLQQQDGEPVDLAVSLGAYVPVGSSTAVAREEGLGAAPRVALGRTVMPWLRVGAELGMQLRPSTTFGGETIGRTAVETALLAHTVGSKIRGELSWHLAVPTDGGSSGSELLGGVRVPAMQRFELFALGGVGLTRAIGTPAYRVLLGLAWSLDVSGDAARNDALARKQAAPDSAARNTTESVASHPAQPSAFALDW